MHNDESLQRPSRPVSLLGSLSFSKGEVAVFSPVIEALMRPVLNAGDNVSFCRTIRAQFTVKILLGTVQ